MAYDFQREMRECRDIREPKDDDRRDYINDGEPERASYKADGVTYGCLEDTGDTYPVCDVCGFVAMAGEGEESDECPECVKKWEATNA